MKISELINLLNKIKEEEGDLLVFHETTDYMGFVTDDILLPTDLKIRTDVARRKSLNIKSYYPGENLRKLSKFS